MSPLSVILFQEAMQRERETRTILGFLSDQIDGEDGSRRTRIMTLKQRLGFKLGLGCCGAIWALRPTSIPVGHDLEATSPRPIMNQDQGEPQRLSVPHSLGAVPVQAPIQTLNPAVSGMNLAAALAAEREFRDGGVGVGAANDGGSATPLRVSLMRLLEETEVESSGGRDDEEGSGRMCCVCMVRKKGAAFIPCGHTFCRECSRELWLNRGSCPLCNRSILDILDIF